MKVRRYVRFVLLPNSVLALFLLCSAALYADVRLPEIFASNMVLQQEMPVPVWGWASAGEQVTVHFENQYTIDFGNHSAVQSVRAVAGADGRWFVTLEPLKASAKPQTLTVSGKNEIKLDNVLVGEVWLCSGQSNMEWQMRQSAEYQDALKTCNNPNIRLFHITKTAKGTPQDHLVVTSSWKAPSAETIPQFSAVGYYFGAKLQKELGVPVGLINSSWGGTRIEPWTPPVGFQSVPALKGVADEITARNPASAAYKQLAAKTKNDYKNWLDTVDRLGENQFVPPPLAFPPQLIPFDSPGQPTTLYNAMIHPFVPLSLRGAIWYQGESNLTDGTLYAEKMKALILGWRSVFNNPDLGFYYVQIAPFIYANQSGTKLPELQESQSSVEKMLPKTGQAIINDLVSNVKDIHPVKKLLVGERLALLALNRTYGKTKVVCSSPEFDRLETNGGTLTVHFKNAKFLKTRDGKVPDWFEIAGEDGKYNKADAEINGTVIKLTSSAVAKPVAVRFAWEQSAQPNVQNEADLPLGPFRAKQ